MLQTMSKPIQNGDFSRAVEKNRSAIAWWYCSCTSPAPSCGWGLQETPARLRRSGSFPARSGWVESRKMRYAAWYAAWTRSIDDMIYHWYHWYLFLRSLRTSTGHPKFYPGLAARIFCRRFFHPTAKQNAQGGCQHPKLRLLAMYEVIFLKHYEWWLVQQSRI